MPRQKLTRAIHLNCPFVLHDELMRYHQLSGRSAAAFVVDLLMSNIDSLRAINAALEVVATGSQSVQSALAPLLAELTAKADEAAQLSATLRGES